MRSSSGIIIALAVAAAVSCGGSQDPAGGSEPTSSDDEVGQPASNPDPPQPTAPLTESECQTFLDHVVELMVQDHNAGLRKAHADEQARKAEEARASGQPAPEPEPFDERTLWTDEDAAKAREELADKLLKRCLKMPRASVECAIDASTAAEMRQC